MILKTFELTKYYGKKLGCRNINIEINEGEIFGLLGPNGAGKSTVVKMITGLVSPSFGEAFLFGKSFKDYTLRRDIGYMPELFSFQSWMTGRDFLTFQAKLNNMKSDSITDSINRVLKLVNLENQDKFKIGTYSKGMKQRIGIAAALIHSPKFLILDEPTSALDPVGRKEIRDILISERQRGTTVLLNSHLLSEVESVCDRVAIINNGELKKQGNLTELLYAKTLLNIKIQNIDSIINEEFKNKLKEYGDLISIKGNVISVSMTDDKLIPNISKLIIESGGELIELTPQKSDLEGYFLKIIKEGGEENV